MIKKRMWPIAFGPVVISAGETQTLTASPQIRFRCMKLMTTGDDVHRTGLRKRLFTLWTKLLRFFSIPMIASKPACYFVQITVGSKLQLPSNTNPIACSSFAPGVLENAMYFDVCEVGQQISLVVQNLSKQPHMFSATLFGEAVEDARADLDKEDFARELAKPAPTISRLVWGRARAMAARIFAGPEAMS